MVSMASSSLNASLEKKESQREITKSSLALSCHTAKNESSFRPRENVQSEHPSRSTSLQPEDHRSVRSGGTECLQHEQRTSSG